VENVTTNRSSTSRNEHINHAKIPM
jgi:hypothetical protein